MRLPRAKAFFTLLLTFPAVSHAASAARGPSVAAGASVAAAIMPYINAIPPELRANVVDFIASRQAGAGLLSEVGRPSAIHSAQALSAPFLDSRAVLPSAQTMEYRMRIATEQLGGALALEQRAHVESAYKTAQRGLFDARAIDRFIHTTTKRIGMALSPDAEGVIEAEYAEYSVMRSYGREVHVLSGHPRHPALLSIFDSHIRTAMAADPEGALALVQGRLTETPEAAAMSREAHEWGIPTFDPTFNLFQRAVNDRYHAAHGNEKLPSIYANLIFLYTRAG